MATISDQPAQRQAEEAWNEAYDRLVAYLKTFELGDHAYVSQLALNLLTEAKEKHRAGAAEDPTTLTLHLAQKHLADWLAATLGQQNASPSHVLPTGYIAILLSQAYRKAPTAFLAEPLPEDLRQALRATLLVTGPDLNVSSMTPRHLDYGPMLQFARQTWHRVDARELLVAVLFWTLVYSVFYWWLSQLM
ncbi:MAG: hypothetical protein WDO13_10160 [Verrucomicrobiota bacterium]